MPYTLVTSEKSPFGRICRMFMLHNKIPFETRISNFVENPEDAAELAKLTPINRVPLLIADGQRKIFDSRVIVNYLIKTHGLKPLSLEEENTVSCAYSCLDAGVTLFLMTKDGFDMNSQVFFLRRQRARIPSNLKYLESWAQKQNLSDWNYASMSLFSFLDWGERRARLLHLKDFPLMGEFYAKFSAVHGVKETTF